MAFEDDLREAMKSPIEYPVFKFALGVFQEAASGRMIGAHLPKPDGPGIYLANIPINRGMLAVLREIPHLNQSQQQALGLRLMNFGEAVGEAQADSRFSGHFKQGDEPGSIMVSDAFTRAYAECRFVISNEHIGPDFDDLLSSANAYGVEEDRSQS